MTSAGLRASFLGASTAVHLAAFVTFGHAPVSPSSDARRVEDIVVDELVSPVDEPGAGPAPLATSRAALAALPTHKHAYPVAPDHDAHPHDASLLHVPFAPPLASPHEELAAQGPEPMVTAPAPARFILVVGTGEARAPSREGVGSASAPGDDEAPLPEADVSSPARSIGAISPSYPPLARAQEVEADVVLAIVVTTAGAVSAARVEKRAGFGFDEAALAAVRAAHFVPARRGGRAVAVRMRLAYSFRLQ